MLTSAFPAPAGLDHASAELGIAALPYHLRSTDRLAQFFEGLELVEPGLVPVTRWRPDAEAREVGV